jgi:two-component system, NtrC family, nitrogen regulation sensor histidine kinase NtrY
MAFNRYGVSVLIRVVLLVINCYAFAHVLRLGTFYWTLFNLGVLLIVQMVMLFRFLTRWQRDVQLFANAVKHGDYALNFPILNRSDSAYALYDLLNNVNRYVRRLKAETEQQSQYFQYIVENAQVGLIAYDIKGKVLIVNNEALSLVGVSELTYIDQLRASDKGLFDQVTQLRLNTPGLLVSSRDRNLKLSARLSKFVVDGVAVNLLSIMNIRPELEENELRSWQELISVLTHEIMNSITPIHSLNGTMHKYLDRVSGNEEIVRKAKENLDVINRRSFALMSFVDRYRKISTVPLPAKSPTDIKRLVDDVCVLLQNDLAQVELITNVESTVLALDRTQIEQVLINIVKNAIAAMEHVVIKRLEIISHVDKNSYSLIIKDSGKGIEPDDFEKIFVPFFTTRQGGSGIGLTLSRQIMLKHGGNIALTSDGGGTTVALSFPQATANYAGMRLESR